MFTKLGATLAILSLMFIVTVCLVHRSGFANPDRAGA